MMINPCNEWNNTEKFTLQWHLTNRCGENCSHCYIDKSSKTDELTFEDCKKIIDDFKDTTQEWSVPGKINFTGGDPFKKERFIELVKYAYSKGIEVGILDNPIEVGEIRQIEKYVYDYQISLDGTREIHDTIRGSDDAFDRAINTLNEFRNFNSKLRVMSTISKKNISSVLELIEEIYDLEFERFDFARFIPIENVENNKNDILNKNEYRKFLYDIFNKNMTSQIEVGTKEPLWTIILENIGLINPSNNKDKIYGGCSVGLNLLAVLPDGTCYPCRRLPIEIGQLPEESIRDVFIESEKLNEFREFESIEKCGQCDLLPYCRGCRAMAYAVNGSYFDEDPNCWR